MLLNVECYSFGLSLSSFFCRLYYSIETVLCKDSLKGFRKDFSCKSVVKIIDYKKGYTYGF